MPEPRAQPVLVAGAASTLLRPLFVGPPRRGTVLGTVRGAVHVRVDGPGCPQLLAVLTRDAVRLPRSVVLAATAAELPFSGIVPGDVVVGEGVLRLGSWRVRAGRWWASRRPRPLPGHPLPPAGGRQAADLVGSVPLPPELAAPVAGLRAALGCGDPGAAAGAATRLVGLGPGLTPAGDDVLTGLLLTLGPSGSDWLAGPVLAEISRPGRTTELSAQLLRDATYGDGIGQVADLLDALAGHGAVEAAVRGLLAVGGTSGRALAEGVLVGAEVRNVPSYAGRQHVEPVAS